MGGSSKPFHPYENHNERHLCSELSEHRIRSNRVKSGTAEYFSWDAYQNMGTLRHRGMRAVSAEFLISTWLQPGDSDGRTIETASAVCDTAQTAEAVENLRLPSAPG